MLMGHAEGMPLMGSAKDVLLADPVSEIDRDEEADAPGQVLYMASFQELAPKTLLYDTIIWVLISLLLVLAWGIGILMLLYLPVRRYVIGKDIASRKLYVTATDIVYKVRRPSFVPFWGEVKIEKRMPLSLVIDVIIEQGCLQSAYGIHTFRLESIAHGKAAPVDELQVLGICNPGRLRKVIVTEASKIIKDTGRAWKPSVQSGASEFMSPTESLTEDASVLRSPSKNWKMTNPQHHALAVNRGVVPSDMLLHKLEEVNKSVKKIESLVGTSTACP